MSLKNENNLNSKKEKELLSRLQDTLANLETDEIVQGMTNEDLKGDGFFGEKDIRISRPWLKEGTERENLVFEPDVDFLRQDDSAKFNELDIENLKNIRDINKNRLIARRKTRENGEFKAGNNVVKEVKEGIEHYTSVIKGKAIIIKDTLHIFPTGIDGRFNIMISPDKMNVHIDCFPAYGDGIKLSADQVLDELKKQKITYGIDKTMVNKIVEKTNTENQKQENSLVAWGRQKVDGNDGRIEFAVDLNNEKTDYRILPDGCLDLENSRNLVLVKKGDLLVKIIPASAGEPGINIHGEFLPAVPGKDVFLKADRGVRISEDGHSLFSDIDGCAVLNGESLFVMNIRIINSDAGKETGDINADGIMLICGSVLDGVEIAAAGDLVVKRNVEAARLTAGRNIEVSGGLHGNNGIGSLNAGGQVFAEYSKDFRLEAIGDININNYSINSQIFTCGQLKMLFKRGTLCGGSVYAQNGLDVKVLGSENGDEIKIEAGEDFFKKKKIKEIDRIKEMITENIKRLAGVLEPILKMMKTNSEALRPKMEIITKTMSKKRDLEEQEKTIDQKRTDFVKQLENDHSCYVRVSGKCFPG
ncbi:MAG: FapA family protein, partial [bacterium]